MPYVSPPHGPRGTGAGFSLIEVLVAIVVLSLGLLGMGALQTTGLAMTNSSLMRLKASYDAYELADRMRANQRAFDPALTGYLTTVATANCTLGVSGSLASDCGSPGSSCTPQEIAQNDLCDWKNELALQLPAGQGTVCVDSTPDDGSPTSPECDGIGPTANGVAALYAIKVWWNDDKSGNLKRFTTSVRP
jgi:type IV pilus assembly protein PilV